MAPSVERLADEKLPVKGVCGATFSPDNHLLAVTSDDGKCRIGDTSSLEHDGSVFASPRSLATFGQHGPPQARYKPSASLETTSRGVVP